MRKLSLVFRIAASAILLQTLFFKFSGAPESVYIFSTLGVEPWGRWFAGCSELVAAGLLLAPPTAALGALASVGIMLGAIGSHLGVLGIVVQDDGGTLFGLACATLFLSVAVAFIERQQFERYKRALIKRDVRAIFASV